jgi:hypothetical protein
MQFFLKMSKHFQNVTCTSSMCPLQLCKVWRMSAKRCKRNWLHKVGTNYSKHVGKITTIHVNFFEKCPNTFKKSHAHLQCVHNNCAKFGKVCEELITHSRYPIWRHPATHPSSIHHSICQMNFVQPLPIILLLTLLMHK